MIPYLDGGGDARFLDKPLAAFEHVPIDQIGQADLDREAAKAYPEASSATRRRQFFTPTLAVLRHAGVAPVVKRPKDGKARTHWIRPADAAKVVQLAAKGRYRNPWAGPLCELFFGGGLRLSEALTLDGKHDVFPDYGYVIVRDPKNGYERVVRLARRTIAALAGLPTLGEPGALFRKPGGDPYTVKDDTGTRLRFIETAVRDAGLDTDLYTVHTFRHSWATWYYAETRDLISLRQNGGWRTVSQCERYTHLATPEIALEAIKLGWDFRPAPVEVPWKSAKPSMPKKGTRS